MIKRRKLVLYTILALLIVIGCPRLSIATTSLPEGFVGEPYSATLKATNGVPPYLWSLVSGTLPAGLNLQPDGTIVGAPQAPPTTSPLTVQVKDGANQTATTNLSIVVAQAPAPTIASVSPQSGPLAGGTQVTIAGSSFQSAATVAFGTAPAPVVSNTPAQIVVTSPVSTAVGPITVTVQNQDGQKAQLVNGFSYFSPVTIVTTSCPNGTVGVPYQCQLQATGGVPPYTWSLATGALPPGLSLSTSGLIAGTPTLAGTFSLPGGQKVKINPPSKKN